MFDIERFRVAIEHERVVSPDSSYVQIKVDAAQELADEIERLREALTAYREARRWATGTEPHRLAIQDADRLNPEPQ